MGTFIFVVGIIYIKDVFCLVTATFAEAYKGLKASTLLAPPNQVIFAGINLVNGFLIGPTEIFLYGIFRIIYTKDAPSLFTDAYIE